MNEQEEVAYETEMRRLRVDADSEKVKNIQQEVMLNQQDQSMIKEQLDLTPLKREIYYQLRGYILKFDESTGEQNWVKDEDNDLSFLTEAGINYCYWTLSGYLNNNILLGNYEEDTILDKMNDIGNTINDTIFMKSHIYFKEPSLEECKKELKRRIDARKEIRKFAYELAGKEFDEEEMEREILKEMENKIEEELNKIKKSLRNDRLKMLDPLVQWMVNQIHASYQRAWMGQERKTLREHIHISETKGGSMNQPQKMGILDHFKRR